jgi:hypothetical protein
MWQLRKALKQYRISRDERGGPRFPYTLYAPGGSGEPISPREFHLMDPEMRHDIGDRGGIPEPWNETQDVGSERVADVFRTRREAKTAAKALELGFVHINPKAPLCWRLYRET